MSSEKKDYAGTLNLPVTSFPMRANLPQKEPEIQKKWDEERLYDTLMQKNDGKPLFVLHDGPPYANGDIHIGHALNKIIKDFVVKNKNMSGFKAPYVPGWDTHGLPIELQMIKKHNVNRNATDPVKFRALCADFAHNCVNNQKAQFRRLGSLGDYDHPYLTLQKEFEAKQIEIFGEMAEKKYIYKGMKPVYWCAHDETALAEAEIEYSDDPCDSIYVKFAVTDDKGKFADLKGEKIYFVIWTTTTWTLPGNMAICVGPDFEYSVMKYGDECYVLATELIASTEKAAGLCDGKCLAKFKGSDLEYIECAHPFIDRVSPVIVGDHVSLDSGTGSVHTAPGHGLEDYQVCLKYKNLKENIIVPVDSKGRLNELAGKYCGLPVAEANVAILNDIRESGALLAVEKIVHQYPHCWRCKSPIIYRATEQWFCSIDGFKDEALKAIKDVQWIPDWGEQRIENMVRDRADWCISRQRIWGVPIPIFYCADCHKPIISKATIKAVADLFRKEGSDAWYKYTPEEILGDLCVCECGCHNLEKETDIMDVWFDSGSSYASVLERENHQFPADLYIEGNDQYRGWFQSSLLTSVATRGTAPYKAVITHGMTVDGEGKKMSKSLGNGIDPLQVTKEYGADVLRLWVSSVDVTGDQRISKDILKQLSEIYRKIRNTIRILLANVGEGENAFNPDTDMVKYEDMVEIDKWALSRLNGLVERVRAYYDNYTFHYIYHDIHNFCTIDMSKLYIDITKDRVYVEKSDSPARRSAQTAMYIIANSLTRLIAPILSFTAEETWTHMAHTANEDKGSVFFNDLPSVNPAYVNVAVEEKYNHLFDFRDDVMKALERARADKVIGKSLEAKITVYGQKDSDVMAQFEKFKDMLSTVFIVSQVELSYEAAPADAFNETDSGIAVKVAPADGEKCARCWMFVTKYDKDEAGQALCHRCRDIING